MKSLNLWATDEVIRGMGLESNLILGVVLHRSFHPPWCHSQIVSHNWAPQKSFHIICENRSHHLNITHIYINASAKPSSSSSRVNYWGPIGSNFLIINPANWSVEFQWEFVLKINEFTKLFSQTISRIWMTQSTVLDGLRFCLSEQIWAWWILKTMPWCFN